MKKLVICMALVLGLMAQVVVAQADEEKKDDKGWAVDASAAYMSRYVWRGIMQVNDPVLQPSINVAKNGFTFNAWGSYNLTGKNDYGSPYGNGKNKFTEIDLTAEYAFSFGDFSLPLGVIYYAFPNTPYSSTTELYAGVTYNWLITPTLKVYQDIDAQHGEYVNFALAYAYDLPQFTKDATWQLALGGNIGWGSSDYNQFYWGANRTLHEDAITDASVTVSVPVKIIDWITIAPSYTQLWLVDDKIKDAAGYDSKNWYGLTLTLSF